MFIWVRLNVEHPWKILKGSIALLSLITYFNLRKRESLCMKFLLELSTRLWVGMPTKIAFHISGRNLICHPLPNHIFSIPCMYRYICPYAHSTNWILFFFFLTLLFGYIIKLVDIINDFFFPWVVRERTLSKHLAAIAAFLPVFLFVPFYVNVSKLHCTKLHILCIQTIRINYVCILLFNYLMQENHFFHNSSSSKTNTIQFLALYALYLQLERVPLHSLDSSNTCLLETGVSF